MKKFILTMVCACLFLPTAAMADNLMRDYVAAPPGTLLSLLYYLNVTGDEANVDGDKAADVDLKQNLFLLREVYYFNLGSLLAAAQIIVPFGHAEENDLFDESSSGIGDIILFGTVWFVNDPASKMYLAFTPYFFLPTGRYDSDQTINLGANRWTFREEVNFTKGFEITPGHDLYLELTLGCDLYTTNDDYAGGHDLSTDPLLNVESHVSYDITKEWVASVDYYGHFGGSSDLDGDDIANSETKSHTLGGTVAYNFAPGWQAMLQYKQDVYNENGIEAQVILARIFYAFDLDKLLH